jgi:hypothetical protein
MKEHNVRQCMESFKKMPTVVAAILLAGLVGMACSSSGLKRSAGDAGAASGGQAGSTISSGATGGTGGTIGPGGTGGGSIGGTGGLSSPGGAGGTNISGTGGIGSGGSNGSGGTAGSSGTGGTGGQGPMCAAYRMCNPGDQQVGMDCPAERECYSLSVSCGSGGYNTTTCVLPESLHCNDPLLCNPGDTPTTSDSCVGYPSPCYENRLCTRSIYCRRPTGPYGGICSGTRSDAGILELPDASVDGSAAGRIPCCGDGIVDYQYGEMCDFGPLNGQCLDSQGPVVNWVGCTYCSPDCMSEEQVGG